MSPRRSMRSAVILQTPMILAAASSVISPPFAIWRNVPVFAEPVHALLGPGLARRHLCASPVQQARDLPVGHQTGKLAHERNQIVGHRETGRFAPARWTYRHRVVVDRRLSKS